MKKRLIGLLRGTGRWAKLGARFLHCNAVSQLLREGSTGDKNSGTPPFLPNLSESA